MESVRLWSPYLPIGAPVRVAFIVAESGGLTKSRTLAPGVAGSQAQTTDDDKARCTESPSSLPRAISKPVRLQHLVSLVAVHG